MHKTNSLLMHAPKTAIFETAANLELWPRILPHYRYIRFLERGPDHNVVVMAAQRSGIPISWTSEQIIDRDRFEIHFHHLKAWTKGMRVVWTFSETSNGVLVTILHELRFRIPALGPIIDPIIGDFFIHNIANKTLRCMKAYVEERAKQGDRMSPPMPKATPKAFASRLARQAQRRAVITGIGPITCIGTGVDSFWNGILAERSGIGGITSFDPTIFRVRCAGEIRDWNPEDFFLPHRLKRLDRYAQFAVVSAKFALDDARIEYSREQPQDRIGVSFGTALGGVCKAEEQYIRYLKKGARGVQPTLAVQVFGGSAHSNIAIEFGFRGVGTTNSNSCASGTVSVGEALRYIRDDFADVIVAGGSEAPLTAITIGAFDIIKTMSRWTGDPPLACRPFDLLRDGFVMGEGGASLVVEELEHARARGARIYAEVLGYSLNNDAFHMTSPLPNGESCIRAMREALADARLAPEQIDYVNAHASSTQLNDSAETASIKQVFGEHAQRIPVSGTKGYYAHPLGATGAIEAALCALALDRQWIPPTINHKNPDPACDLDIVPNHGRAAELNYVMSNSFGFGGINACVVLGKIRD